MSDLLLKEDAGGDASKLAPLNRGHKTGNLHDGNNMPQQSNTANELLTLAYTTADKEIIENSQKNMGIKGKKITTANSEEPETTNKTSPIAKRKPNKYGI